MTGQVGEVQAGVLSFTDSLGFTKVDVPVSANVASSAGLWVGSAAITRVGEYLKSYAQDATNGLLTVTDTNSANYGAYVVTGTNTQLGSVSRTYPLRLIVHNPASGNPAILLQHVFYGVDVYSNTIVTTSEDALSRSSLKDARRISATHLPWSAANAGWAFSGNLDQTSMVATVTTDYDDSAANPFVHTYHPDHDNLSADGSAKLAQGAESYAIRREIVLSMMPPTDDFDSYVSKSKTLSGDYSETITLLGMAHTAGTDTREFHVRGVFSLNRITDIPTLTPAPVTP
jgi:hypothetical protein